MKKKLYFGSNLKMYKNIQDTVKYLQDLVALTKDISREEMERFPYRPRLVLNGVGEIPPDQA